MILGLVDDPVALTVGAVVLLGLVALGAFAYLCSRR